MRRRTAILLGLIAVILIGFVALQTPLLKRTRETSWRAITSVTGSLFGIGSLRIDNDVATQLERLTAENVRLKAELTDYEALREQLQSPSLESRRFIPALVQPQPLNAWRSELLLNKGVQDGVTLGAPVVVNGSVLACIVSELADHTATCRLLVHPQVSLPAEVQAEETVRGLLTGVTHTTMRLNTIPRDKEINLGQPVVTASDQAVPAGLLVGNIETITDEENEAYQHAQLSLPYDPAELRAVTIVVAP